MSLLDQATRTRVDVCVCTYRRESVVDTLRSLIGQGDGVRLRVIVADNDEIPSARERVEKAAITFELDVRYVHCPAGNISLARNAALDAANADWIAFIDDDETAAPGWLSALLARAEATHADIVLGHVVPIYRDDAPKWMRQGNFHATRPEAREGRIVTGYTSNALMRASTAGSERFRLELGRSGGEDTEFFARLHARGARIVEAPDAVVTEKVPPERAHLGWLMRRRYRFGQTHATVALQRSAGVDSKLRLAAVAACKVAFCLAGAVLTWPSRRRRAFWLLRGALHAGIISRTLGHSELVQYGS